MTFWHKPILSRVWCLELSTVETFVSILKSVGATASVSVSSIKDQDQGSGSGSGSGQASRIRIRGKCIVKLKRHLLHLGSPIAGVYRWVWFEFREVEIKFKNKIECMYDLNKSKQIRMSKLSVGESVYASTILSIEVKLKSLCPCIYKFVHFELATYLQHSFCHEPWTVCEGGAEKESSTIERPTVGFTAEENRASFFSSVLSFEYLTGSLGNLKRPERQSRQELKPKRRQLHSSVQTSASGNAFSEWFYSLLGGPSIKKVTKLSTLSVPPYPYNPSPPRVRKWKMSIASQHFFMEGLP